MDEASLMGYHSSLIWYASTYKGSSALFVQFVLGRAQFIPAMVKIRSDCREQKTRDF